MYSFLVGSKAVVFRGGAEVAVIYMVFLQS